MNSGAQEQMNGLQDSEELSNVIPELLFVSAENYIFTLETGWSSPKLEANKCSPCLLKRWERRIYETADQSVCCSEKILKQIINWNVFGYIQNNRVIFLAWVCQELVMPDKLFDRVTSLVDLAVQHFMNDLSEGLEVYQTSVWCGGRIDNTLEDQTTSEFRTILLLDHTNKMMFNYDKREGQAHRHTPLECMLHLGRGQQSQRSLQVKGIFIPFPGRDMKSIFKGVKAYDTEGGKDDFQLFLRARQEPMVITEKQIRVDMRKNFWTVGVVQHWDSLPCAVVDPPSLEFFKQRLNGHLSGMLYHHLPMAGGWIRWPDVYILTRIFCGSNVVELCWKLLIALYLQLLHFPCYWRGFSLFPFTSWGNGLYLPEDEQFKELRKRESSKCFKTCTWSIFFSISFSAELEAGSQIECGSSFFCFFLQ